MLDSGVLPHSGCLAAHVAAHDAAPGPTAVTGYMYGFSLDYDDTGEVEQLVDVQDADAAIERLLALGEEGVVGTRRDGERLRRVDAGQYQPPVHAQALQGLHRRWVRQPGGQDDIGPAGLPQRRATVDNDISAKLPGQVVLVGGAGDGDGLKSAGAGELEGQVPEAANAEDGDPLVRRGTPPRPCSRRTARARPVRSRALRAARSSRRPPRPSTRRAPPGTEKPVAVGAGQLTAVCPDTGSSRRQ
jgi:hypothetical protein